MGTSNALVEWLLAGDPAIRWQTLRDLQDAPPAAWQAEQRRTLQEGWGAQLLALQAPDGTWGGGIYSPKWISTTYTLLTLCAIGIPHDHAPAQRAAALVLDEELGSTRDDRFMRKLAVFDRCIVGMDLQLAAYFGVDDARVDALVENLLAEMMPDGGWNCRRHRRPEPHHSSFHTTFNVLEGLRTWLETTPQHPLRNDVLAAEHRALEFMLEHRLFKSDKTGAVINDKFTLLSHPHHWHYDVLRGFGVLCARRRAARRAAGGCHGAAAGAAPRRWHLAHPAQIQRQGLLSHGKNGRTQPLEHPACAACATLVGVACGTPIAGGTSGKTHPSRKRGASRKGCVYL